MAVYQGARRRAFGPFGPVGLPAPLRPAAGKATPASRAARAHGRRTGRARVGLIRPSTQRVGLILAAIVVVFCAAFLWLTQSVQLAATNYDIARLSADQDRLQALEVDLQGELDQAAGPPAIRQSGFGQGLGQLGAPLLVPAR